MHTYTNVNYIILYLNINIAHAFCAIFQCLLRNFAIFHKKLDVNDLKVQLLRISIQIIIIHATFKLQFDSIIHAKVKAKSTSKERLTLSICAMKRLVQKHNRTENENANSSFQ